MEMKNDQAVVGWSLMCLSGSGTAVNSAFAGRITSWKGKKADEIRQSHSRLNKEIIPEYRGFISIRSIVT